MRTIFYVLVLCLLLTCPMGTRAADPIFDHDAIASQPLDGVTLNSSEKDGIVTERIEFTSRTVGGKAERVNGLLMFPRGARLLPGVLWCMGGMAGADGYFPGMYAKKGYAAIAITLPHNIRNSWAAFDARDPSSANLTLLAIDQMRALTYLSQRPEVDANRLGVAGASYGGFFATLVAGADPRVKAGMSYFAGGRHDLGTNLPQFIGMRSKADVEIWMKTIDPAWRLAERDVPFMWGVAANDNWFSLPALIATYRVAKSAGKRMVVMPHWQHGFPPDVDETLNNFLDTTLGNKAKAYNQPAALKIENSPRGLVASWSWTGERKIVKAELAVTYGPNSPWLSWQHRATLVVPATLGASSASANLPIPERDITGIAWGNFIDETGATISTEPLEFNAAKFGVANPDPSLVLDGFPRGDLSPDDLHFFAAQGFPLTGKPDRSIKQAGEQSLRIDPDPSGAKTPPVEVHVHHVPLHGHRATVWLRADPATKLSVFVAPFRPQHWRSPAVESILLNDAHLGPLHASLNEPLGPISPKVVEVGPEWKEVVLDVPWDGTAIENYSLVISQPLPGKSVWWYDSLKFETVWKK